MVLIVSATVITISNTIIKVVSSICITSLSLGVLTASVASRPGFIPELHYILFISFCQEIAIYVKYTFGRS